MQISIDLITTTTYSNRMNTATRTATATAIAARINAYTDSVGSRQYAAKVWTRGNDVRIYVQSADGSRQYGSATVHANGKTYHNYRQHAGTITAIATA